MLWIWGALWGAAGGATVELLALSADIKAAHQVPWKGKEYGPWPDLIAITMRVAAGALLAGAATAGGEVSGAFGAFGFGVAAPMIVEKLLATFVPSSWQPRTAVASSPGEAVAGSAGAEVTGDVN